MPTAVLAAIASAIAVTEFCRLSPTPMARPLSLLAVAASMLLVANAGAGGSLAMPLISASVLVPFLVMVLLPPPQRSPAVWAWSVAGVLLIGLTLSLAVLLRREDQGREWVLTTVGLTFAIDTAAYFFGKALGKHKLAPSISPGKTWEGSIAGFVMAGVAAAALTSAFGLGVPLWQATLLGLAVGVIAQLGDLAESTLKRAAGAKDAGSLVPGHGGLLDRLDSLIPSFAVLYFFVAYLK